MTSCRPFLLAILKKERDGAIPAEEVETLFKEVYVLLVRRKVAELPVTRYDSFFPSLVDRIAGSDRVAPTMALLHEAIRKEQLWVGDEVFKEALVRRPVYRSQEIGFTRLILEEIDRHLAGVYSGELPDYSTLDTVEHVAPQNIETRFLERPGSLQLSQVQVLIVVSSLSHFSMGGSDHARFTCSLV